MAATTGKQPGNGTSTLSYAIPAAGLDVESVYASIDTTGAAGAVTAELTIADQSGAVIARKVQNTTIDQGVAGSATWALQLLDDCITTPSNPTFAQTVATIGPAGTLRGYWRLGENASPFADTSGYSLGPSNMAVTATGTAYTTHVTGALPPTQDDGALQFNAVSSGGYYISTANASCLAGAQQNLTIACWLKPTASALAFSGGVLANQSVIAGSPSHLEGYAAYLNWSGGNVAFVFGRWVNNTVIGVGELLTAGVYTFCVATYDGATITLYKNGSSAATIADSRAYQQENPDFATIGRMRIDNSGGIGQPPAVIDEVAVWATVLSSSEIATLYAAGL